VSSQSRRSTAYAAKTAAQKPQKNGGDDRDLRDDFDEARLQRRHQDGADHKRAPRQPGKRAQVAVVAAPPGDDHQRKDDHTDVEEVAEVRNQGRGGLGAEHPEPDGPVDERVVPVFAAATGVGDELEEREQGDRRHQHAPDASGDVADEEPGCATKPGRPASEADGGQTPYARQNGQVDAIGRPAGHEEEGPKQPELHRAPPVRPVAQPIGQPHRAGEEKDRHRGGVQSALGEEHGRMREDEPTDHPGQDSEPVTPA
jgi:hypothetical protein